MNKKAAVKIGMVGVLAVLSLVCLGSGGWRYAGAAEKDPIEISDEIDSWYHEALILYQKGKQRAARDKLDYVRNTLESNYMVQLWRQNTNARPTIEDVNGLIKDIDAYLDQEKQRRLGLIRETELHKEEVRARKLAAREVARREREEARKRRQAELAAQKKARERERAMRASKQEAERKAREALLAQKRQAHLAEQAERRQEEETRKQKRLEEIARQKAEKEARKQALRAQREERRRAKEEELARKREERMKEKEMLLARRDAERKAHQEEKQRLREERLKERERIREQKKQARQAKEEELARIREERHKEQEAHRVQREQELLARREERARLIEQKRLTEEREQAEREARRQERLAKLAEERAARQEEIENLREHQRMLKEQRRQEQEKYERELSRQKDEQRQKEKELRLAKKEAREKSEQIGDLDKEVRNLERAVAEMKQSSSAKQQRAIIRIDDMSKEIHYQKLRIKDMEQSERLREREARVQAREQALKREEERLARLQSGQERQLAKQRVGREKKPLKEEAPPAQLKEQQQEESKPPALSEAEARKLALLREKEELRQARLQAKEEARKVRIEEEAARREEARQIKEKRRLEKEKQRQEVLAKRQAREEAKRKERELAQQRKEEERRAREEAKRKEQELARQRKEEERVTLAAARRREEMTRAASQQKHVEDAAKVAKIEKIWKESLRLYKLGMFEEAVKGFQEVVVLEGNPRIKYTPEAKRLIEEAEQKIIERDQAQKKIATINEVENVEREMLQEVLNRQVAPYVEPPQKQVALNEDTLIEPPVIRKKLARKRVTMDFDKVGLKSVMRFLSQESGINYVASQKVLNLDPMVTARFTDATLEEVTKYVTKSLGLVYRIDKEVIWIADPEEIANEPMETRVYYLRKGGGLFTEFSPVSGGGDTGLGGSSASVNKIYTIEDTLKEMVPWPGDAKLTYDKRLNALIVRNTPQNLQMMEDILYNLDIEPCQILIEARFIEVDVTDINDLGLEWTLPADFATDKKDGALKMGIGSGSGIDFSDFTRAAEGLNFTYKGVLTEPQFNLVLHALEESKKIKTLSSPRITTLNNQMASIKVVDEWIYPTRYEFEVVQSDVNGDGDFNDAGETVYKNVPKDFLRRDVGILLKVIPAVGADRRTVSLSLIPEVSEATADAFEFTGDVKLPKFTSRNLSTTIVVNSAETVVLGGLIKESRTRTETKVPLLSDLPFVGGLFRKDADSIQRKNLLIFVTAKVLNASGEEIVVTSQQ